MDKAWKAYERWVAKFFGTTRNPLSGKNAGGNRTGDVIHSHLNIECKNHKSMPIVDWMQKAIKESSKSAEEFAVFSFGIGTPSTNPFINNYPTQVITGNIENLASGTIMSVDDIEIELIDGVTPTDGCSKAFRSEGNKLVFHSSIFVSKPFIV